MARTLPQMLSDLRLDLADAEARVSVSVSDSPYTTSEETIIGVQSDTGTISIILASDQAVEGKTYIIKDEGGIAGTNNITVSTEGSETIDLQDELVIAENLGTRQLYCDDSGNWFVL